MTARELEEAASQALWARNYADAARIYEDLSRAEPSDARHAMRAGDIYRLMGRNGEALECYRQAATSYADGEKWVKAIAVCKVILEIEAGHPAALAMLDHVNARRANVDVEPVLDRPETTPVIVPLDYLPDDDATEVSEVEDFSPRFSPSVPDTTLEQRVVTKAENLTSRPASVIEELISHALDDLDPAEQSFDPGAFRSKIDPARIPLLSDLPRDAFLSLLDRSTLRRVEAGAEIVREGEEGTSLFILVSGRARVVKAQPSGMVELDTIEEGSFFGEMALLTGDPRAASVIAVEDCDVLEIDQRLLLHLADAFPAVAGSITQFYRERLLNRVSLTSPLFRAVRPEARPRLAAAFELREAAANEVLIEEGQPGTALYVIATGAALVTRRDGAGQARPVNVMVDGDVFGEISLLTGKPTTATVTARRRMLLLVLPQSLFRPVAAAFPQTIELARRLWHVREARDRKMDAAARNLVHLRERALQL